MSIFKMLKALHNNQINKGKKKIDQLKDSLSLNKCFFKSLVLSFLQIVCVYKLCILKERLFQIVEAAIDKTFEHFKKENSQ